MCKFSTTATMAKNALNLARDIFAQMQNPNVCEYYDKDAKPGQLVKCQHSKNKKVLPAKDDKPERSIKLTCTLTNCPFVNGR